MTLIAAQFGSQMVLINIGVMQVYNRQQREDFYKKIESSSLSSTFNEGPSHLYDFIIYAWVKVIVIPWVVKCIFHLISYLIIFLHQENLSSHWSLMFNSHKCNYQFAVC